MSKEALDVSSSSFWLDKVLDQVEARLSKEVALGSRKESDVVVISSGITPSGPYHVGHAREILTGELVLRGLKKRGHKVDHLHFVDAYDALRKRYPYLPESYEQEAGKPVFIVPAPDGIHKSYADQYFSEYKDAADLLGIDMTVMWTQDEYIKGLYADLIVLSLQKRDEIAAILKRISHRDVDSDWQPVQILDETNSSLRTAKFVNFDANKRVVTYIASDGTERIADMVKGQVKLDWRCDWPARWKLFGVTVEGFGREHATKGGSYDTGKAIVEEIYNGTAPIPVPYDTINLKGDNKKMSSSLGNLVTIQQTLEIIPPEILRFFIFRYLPLKKLDFDPGIGLYNLIDEVAKIDEDLANGKSHEFGRAWELAKLSEEKSTVASVRFSHLVELWQTAQKDFSLFIKLLSKTHPEVAERQGDVLKEEVCYLQNWLDKYAPDSVKFSILDEAPGFELNEEESRYINELLNRLKETTWEGDDVHNIIYLTSKDLDVSPRVAFRLLYKIFIGKESGPKLGYFLATLERDFVLGRVETVAEARN